MALVNSNQHGATYQWGVDATDAPAITGFVARGAELTYEPEVMSTATNGEGHVDSVTNSKPGNRKITGKFTGYVNDSWDATTVADNFTFESRFYIVGPISEPRKKGDYWEVTIDATSYALVTS